MVALISLNQRKGRPVSRGKSPRIAAMFQIPLDFTVDLTLKFSADMSENVQNKWGIEGVQSVKIDNSLNSDVLTLTFDTGDIITCPAYSMGIFPLLYTGGTLEFIATSNVAVLCNVWLLNTREQAQIWTAKIPVAGTVNVTGSTIFVQKTQDTFDEFSQVITTGGTAQLLMAANANRKGIFIRNPGTPASQGIAATEPIYIGFGAAFAGMAVGALGAWELFPGEQLPAFDPVPTEAVYIVAATTNHRVTAKSMS